VSGALEIRMRASVRDAMIAHAREEAPVECCGLLLGTRGLIEEAIRTHNLRRSTTAYLIDPADHFAAIRRARMEGRMIVGAYHSHPRSPAAPSAVDLREAHDADLVYLIVSLADPRTPDVRGYRLASAEFVAAALLDVP
jgi:[CysO sulfur-carrier protein]-S-L-cysteine hydrolase